MQPAWSIIVFTTLSGAGYGLLFWLGVAVASGLPRGGPGFAAAALGFAFVTVTAGLAASTLHLGRPERAWRAFSQWRSSWLSREGVLSVATYLPGLLLAWRWGFAGADDALARTAALAAAAGAAATVLCTAYIYRSLKPVAQWDTGWVPLNYLALAAMTGALWLAALARACSVILPHASWLAGASIVAAAALKLLYWRHIDGRPGAATVASATGLGRFGTVRLFEAPNTSASYLMKEMGFAIARRHAAKLRRIALQLGFLMPLLLTLLAAMTRGWAGGTCALAAALAALAGVLVERWLFFAEARHTVTLYYGAARA